MNRKIFYIIIVILIMAITVVAYLLGKSVDGNKNNKEQVCSLNQTQVNIVLITDSRYTTPTMISMLSAIENKCPNSIYNYYIVAENITSQDKNNILKLKSLSPQTVNINIIDQEEPDLPFENMQRFLQYKVGMHKIFLPKILSNLDKVIYMDGDTVVLKDLSQLYSIDVENVYAAVAKDGIFYRFPKEMKEMGVDKRGFYFNSGVMLYNLKLQRQDDMVEKLVEYVKTHDDFYGDQDVLNVVLGNKLKLMSYRYNCISTFFEADDLAFLSSYFGEELPKQKNKIYEKSTIIHYAGDKPWQNTYSPLYLKEIWYKYYNKVRML